MDKAVIIESLRNACQLCGIVKSQCCGGKKQYDEKLLSKCGPHVMDINDPGAGGPKEMEKRGAEHVDQWLVVLKQAERNKKNI